MNQLTPPIAFFVSPIITAVDKALAENASGRQALIPSFVGTLKDCIKSPVAFCKTPAFKWIWFIYAGTYFSANAAQTFCAQRDQDPAFTKWLASSVVNTTTCILKDRAFAQEFGTGVAKAVPKKSLAIWTLRDFMAMYAFITLPPIVGKAVGDFTQNEKLGQYSAQFAVPLLFCYILTPVHLWGYDVYNNPQHSLSQSMQLIKKDYNKAVMLKMVRSLPPWTVGVIANTELRKAIGNALASDV